MKSGKVENVNLRAKQHRFPGQPARIRLTPHHYIIIALVFFGRYLSVRPFCLLGG